MSKDIRHKFKQGVNMSRVIYNQAGYVGCSMSENARRAYETGEMPISKWTKKAIIERIVEEVNNYDYDVNLDIVKQMSKLFLQKYAIHWSSWHHTGKFARETDFYELDEDFLEDFAFYKKRMGRIK